jgi:hypothetical protein
VRHDRRRDRAVVGEELALGDPVVREEDAVGVTQIDVRRNALCSLTISRAITRRWIWFVPS